VAVELTIAGSGPAEAELRAALAGASVEFSGTLDSDQLLRLFRSQDVFLLVSQFEGLSIGMLEAMGQGCVPLVSAVRSGATEAIRDGENGMVAPIGDIPAFAVRLEALFADAALRERLGRAAHASIAEGGPYHVEKMVEEYRKLFESLENQPFRRPRGAVEPPPEARWQERLPAAVQRVGHYGRRCLRGIRG
jgi:glycosyltransferase involved in cell wall biosynthesis